MAFDVNNLYFAALSKSPGGVLILNDALQVEFINDWLLAAIFSDAKFYVNMPVLDLLPHAEKPRFLNAIQGALQQGIATKLSTTFDANLLELHDPNNGSSLSHSTTISSLEIEKQVFCLINIVDETKPLKRAKLLADSIYKLKEAEVQLNESRDVALKASKAKGEFIALMSHQLRTPLNAIVGFSELLSTGALGELNEEQQDSAKQIFDAGSELSDFVSQILMISEFSDSVKVGKEPVSLSAEVISTLNSLQLEQSSHKINVHYNDSAKMGAVINTDRRLLQSLLKNLLTITVACQLKSLAIEISSKYINDKAVHVLIFKGGYERIQLRYSEDTKQILQIEKENLNTDMDMTFLLELSQQMSLIIQARLTYSETDGICLIVPVKC